MVRKYLERKVGKNTRYYLLELYLNLFGEYVIERVYGNVAFKRHTGKVVEFFDSKDSATQKMMKILKEKQRKGYEVIKSSQNG